MDTKTVRAISDYIKSNAETPFEWGVFDCCIFSSHVINMQTGLDLHGPYAGKYDSETSAKSLLKKLGTIEHNLDGVFERIDSNNARRGDVSKLESGVMAVHFSGVLWATTESGVKPTSEKPVITWRVA